MLLRLFFVSFISSTFATVGMSQFYTISKSNLVQPEQIVPAGMRSFASTLNVILKDQEGVELFDSTFSTAGVTTTEVVGHHEDYILLYHPTKSRLILMKDEKVIQSCNVKAGASKVIISTEPQSGIGDASGSLTGLLNLTPSEENELKPNVVFSNSWKIKKNYSMEARFTAFQGLRDTVLVANGVQIFNPDISDWSLRVAGYGTFDLDTKFGFNYNMNVYSQNISLVNNSDLMEDKIINWSFSGGVNYEFAPELILLADFNVLSKLEGKEIFAERFGADASSHFTYFSVAAQIGLSLGNNRIFLEPQYLFKSSDMKEVAGADPGIFTIKIGVRDPFD